MVGVAYESLKQYRRVAARFPDTKGNRLPNLTWTHHMVVAGRDDAEELLAIAESDGLSVDELRGLFDQPHVANNSGENEWYRRCGRRCRASSSRPVPLVRVRRA